eukprot:scaffold89926_cov78-Cyclotella_meneghiniana.AAC.2
MRASKDSDPPLPTIPENIKPTKTVAENEDEEDDKEEQLLFEKDNAAAEDVSDNIGGVEEEEQETIVEHKGPIFVESTTSGDKWELSWPIWHMLPRNERRAIAAKHGYKTIGEFEEFMSLTRAVDESEGRVQELSGLITLPAVADHEHDGVEFISRTPEVLVAQTTNDPSDELDWHPPLANLFAAEKDDSSISSVEEEEDINIQSYEPVADESADLDLEIHLENIKLGGLPCQLPDEILHKCFSYLSVDDHAPLTLVSPHWSRFTRCEALYKTLCERVYLNQSKRKQLHVSRFGSYRNMLELRPRVRTGAGVYVLKYTEVRKIQRDMWTEIPLGAVLESVYYRYLYFFEDGRVMYALTHATPLEMIPRFKRMLIHGYGSVDKWGVWGEYQLRKDELVVKVHHDWHDVCFQLRVIPSNKVLDYDSGDRGMHTTLELQKHMSSAMGDFDEEQSPDLVNYEVPLYTYFRFLRDKRL